jgi:hypothetical protein
MPISQDQLSLIPEAELRKDLRESYVDAAYCHAALKIGVYGKYTREEVQRRASVNEAIIRLIEGELSRRGVSAVVVLP